MTRVSNPDHLNADLRALSRIILAAEPLQEELVKDSLGPLPHMPQAGVEHINSIQLARRAHVLRSEDLLGP